LCRCGDGTQLIVAVHPGDNRAHLQIDGRDVTLPKRFAISGARDSSGGPADHQGRRDQVRHLKRD
jgi:membrane-bound inhibitor of C-type lysozyme